MKFAYPPVRRVAASVQEHYRKYWAEHDSRPAPDFDHVEAIVNAGFWASLRREENYSPNISLALLPPRPGALHFEKTIPLSPEPLAKLAPAAERPGIHLGVWPENGELRVWGATRKLPAFCLVLEVVAPGLLVVKHSREEESGKFVNIVVLEGDRVKVLSRETKSMGDCPPVLDALLAFEAPVGQRDGVNVLVQLATSMRAHRRGGSLLIVPENSDCWSESIVSPVSYGMAPAYSSLAKLMRQDEANHEEQQWLEYYRKSIELIAGFTAVDGATILSSSYELLAFGAKIRPREGRASVDRVLVTEPIEDGYPFITDPAQLGGTRHMSAAQFVSDQRDAAAMVASQDGRFTVFAWSQCEEMVHAHRVEVLLL